MKDNKPKWNKTIIYITDILMYDVVLILSSKIAHNLARSSNDCSNDISVWNTTFGNGRLYSDHSVFSFFLLNIFPLFCRQSLSELTKRFS